MISALSNQKIKTKNSINKNREYTNRYQSDSPFLNKKTQNQPNLRIILQKITDRSRMLVCLERE